MGAAVNSFQAVAGIPQAVQEKAKHVRWPVPVHPHPLQDTAGEQGDTEGVLPKVSIAPEAAAWQNSPNRPVDRRRLIPFRLDR